MNPIKFRRYWPNATRRQAAVQAVRLAKAKQYMADNGIVAIDQQCDFKYARSQGVVLS